MQMESPTMARVILLSTWQSQVSVCTGTFSHISNGSKTSAALHIKRRYVYSKEAYLTKNKMRTEAIYLICDSWSPMRLRILLLHIFYLIPR